MKTFGGCVGYIVGVAVRSVTQPHTIYSYILVDIYCMPKYRISLLTEKARKPSIFEKNETYVKRYSVIPTIDLPRKRGQAVLFRHQRFTLYHTVEHLK